MTFTNCAKDIPGINPPELAFFYPTALYLDSSEKTLFVTNGNSDLRYNGSTILALDMEKIISMTADPLTAGNCSADPENPSEFLCSLSDELLRSSLRTGNFAGDIVHVKSTLTDGYRLLFSVRGDPSITWVDVKTDSEGNVTCMDCGNGCTDSFPRDCSSSNKIFIKDGLASDPFKLYYDSDLEYVLVTHLSEPVITVIDTLSEPPVVVQVTDDFFVPSTYGYTGGYEIISAGTTKDEYFATNAYGPEIVKLKMIYSEDDAAYKLIFSDNYYLQAPWGPFEIGAEARGMALSSENKWMYTTVRNPPMLLIHDLEENEYLELSMNLQNYVEIPLQPSAVKTSDMAYGYELVYIANFSSGILTVVDPVDGIIVDEIECGSGPGDFIFVDFPEFRGIITANFGEGTLSFIKIENGIHKRIGRLGTPQKIGS